MWVEEGVSVVLQVLVAQSWFLFIHLQELHQCPHPVVPFCRGKCQRRAAAGTTPGRGAQPALRSRVAVFLLQHGDGKTRTRL